ncbi:MAG: substrate-binding domain-containing protein [Kiloniellales bacterium]|nr:substrate-binding domain-containing protein [Kiloniellales bacterium]
MIRRSLLALAAAVMVLGNGVQPGQAEELSVASSTTVANAVLLPYKSQIEKRTRLRLAVDAVGSGNGVLALMQGRAQIAAISAPLADVVQRLNSKRPGSVDGRSLQQHDIGSTKVAFVVHPSNPVKDLSFEQIADILAGRITLWSELGGINMPIRVISEPRGGGIRTMVEKTIGEWGDVLTKTHTMQSASLVAFAVSRMPNAIGIASHTTIDNNVFVLNSDRVIEQPLFLVTRGDPDARMKKLIEVVRAMSLGKKAGA